MWNGCWKNLENAYSILIRKDLSNIEEASGDVCYRLTSKGDACRSVKPAASNIQLDTVAIGCVLERDSGLGDDHFEIFDNQLQTPWQKKGSDG